MYERDLQDLIRGLRSDAAKRDEGKYIGSVIEEIRHEVVSTDMDTKGGAICKLIYLDMLGYDMSWASFYVVEVMSSPLFHLKSGGYLGAVQSFDETTEVLTLATNLMRKDLSSANLPDVLTSLNCLGQILTPSLAHDLSGDLVPMLHHSKPSVRKRAVLVLYKMVTQDLDMLEGALPRFKDKLEDPDITVVSATVNAICELARREPRRSLSLAPSLFGLLTSSSNNWMLIKIVKLFGTLTPHEPRLIRKLQPPITDLISTTPAISLLYECVHTCIIGHMFQGSSGADLARTCVNKLATFLDDSDQNLKYIALLALVKIVPSYPHLVAEHHRLILRSIDDQDISIRMRALDLIVAMASPQTLQSLVQHLLSHLAQDSPASSAQQSLSQILVGANSSQNPSRQSTAYRIDVSKRILDVCCDDFYANVEDFEWLLSVFVDLAYLLGRDIGHRIHYQLLDLTVRVKGVRSFAVPILLRLLQDSVQSSEITIDGSFSKVLEAAVWICGEYSSEIDEPLKAALLLLDNAISCLPAHLRAMCITASTKILGELLSRVAYKREDNLSLNEAQLAIQAVRNLCAPFCADGDAETQERAVVFFQLLGLIENDLQSSQNAMTERSEEMSTMTDFPSSLLLIHPLMATYDLNAVAPGAQDKVPVPNRLDLSTPIIPVLVNYIPTGKPKPGKPRRKKVHDLQQTEVRTISHRADHAALQAGSATSEVDDIPIVRIDDLPIPMPGPRIPGPRLKVDTAGELPQPVRAATMYTVDVDPGAASTDLSIASTPAVVKVFRAKKTKQTSSRVATPPSQ